MNHLCSANMMVCVVMLVVGVGCLEFAAIARGDGAGATTASSGAVVEIDNFNFKPKELAISAGTAVTWVNKDDVPHTATGTGDPPVFDSKALDTDDKFAFRFSKPGKYADYCKVHPHMTGTIIVK